jgi:hypothetical protein
MTLILMTGFNAGVKETALFSSQPKVPTASDLCTGYYGYPIMASDLLQATLSGATKPMYVNASIRLNTLATGDSFRIELTDGGSNSIRVQMSRTGNTVTWTLYNGGTQIGVYTKGQNSWFTLGFEVDSTLTRMYVDAVECLSLSGGGNGISWTPTIFKAYLTNAGSTSYVSLDDLVINTGAYEGIIRIYPIKPQAVGYEELVNSEMTHYPLYKEAVSCLADMALDNEVDSVFTSNAAPAQTTEQLFICQKLPVPEGIEEYKTLALRISSIFALFDDTGGITGYSQILYKNPGYNKIYDTIQSVTLADGYKIRQVLLINNPDTGQPWTIEELNNFQIGIKNKGYN